MRHDRAESGFGLRGDPSLAPATVDASGTASGLAAGTTTIRATVAGSSAEATLIVN